MTGSHPAGSGDADLTTAQAARFLHVSRHYLLDLLAKDEIECRDIDGETRVLATSLTSYKHRDDAQRRAVADELSRLTQD